MHGDHEIVANDWGGTCYTTPCNWPLNHFTDAGALALANCPRLARIESLDLSGNIGIGAAGRAALQNRFGKRLRLKDDWCDFDDY